MKLNEEDFAAWRANPVTQEIMKLLAAKREALRQAWEGGSFTDYEKDGTILTNVGNLGTCKGFAFVMELDYEVYLTETEDDKRIGVIAPGSSGAD